MIPQFVPEQKLVDFHIPAMAAHLDRNSSKSSATNFAQEIIKINNSFLQDS